MKQCIEKGGKISFSVLVSLAPIMDKETLDVIVDRAIQM